MLSCWRKMVQACSITFHIKVLSFLIDVFHFFWTAHSICRLYPFSVPTHRTGLIDQTKLQQQLRLMYFVLAIVSACKMMLFNVNKSSNLFVFIKINFSHETENVAAKHWEFGSDETTSLQWSKFWKIFQFLIFYL